MDWSLCKIRKGTPIPRTGKRKIQRPHNTRIYTDGPGRKSRIHVRNQSAINTKRPIINIQRGTRSHHRRNTEATDSGGQKSDIHILIKHHDGDK
jgi:hypothetical protein